MKIGERNKRATAACLATCIKEAFGDDPALASTVAHLKRRAEGKAEIRLEFDHAELNGRDKTRVTFTTPPGATPKMLGQACSVLLAHCRDLAELDDEETVIEDIVRLARSYPRLNVTKE